MSAAEPLDLDAWKRPSIAELFDLLTRAHLGGGKPADRWARMAVSVQKLVDSREAVLIVEVRRLREERTAHEEPAHSRPMKWSCPECGQPTKTASEHEQRHLDEGARA